MITLNILSHFNDLSSISRLAVVLIVSGFMPLTAMSFFWFMRSKKQKDFDKSMKEMGISSSRRVKDTYSFSNYFLPVSFSFVICLLASAYFLFADIFSKDLSDSLLLTGALYGGGEENAPIVKQSLAVLAFAFFGSFIWSAQNIIRRLIAYDLSPSVYYSAGVRIMLASLVALVLSFLIGKETNFQLDSSLAVIAFLTGMFPQRVLSYLVNWYKDIISPDKLNNEDLSLYKIEGMSVSHKERMEEIGIDNAQNLATASLTKMLIETPYGSRQLLDWIGQAKLICYAKGDIDALRSVGIRTVYDMKSGNKSREALREISDAIGLTTPLLEVVREQIDADKGIEALYNFHHNVNDPKRDVAYEDLENDESKAVG